MSRCFVTGATGFVGSHFVLNQVARQEIHALVRATDVEGARQRLTKKLGVAAAGYAEPPAYDVAAIDPILGDIEVPGLGIDPGVVAALRERGIDTFWHFASSLNFEEEQAEKIQRTNIGGVRNVLAFAAELGVKRFVYCSTAYTAGALDGVIPEALHHLDGTFNNLYETSKCNAEHIVAERCVELGMECAIVRPSVVIGVSSTKEPAGTKTGLYAFARDLYFLKRAVDQLGIEPQLLADAETYINFTPIDGVMADLQYLIEHDFPDGPVYHLSGSWTVQVKDIVDFITRTVGLTRFRLVKEQTGNRTPIDELIGRRADFYRGYLFGEKEFARSIPLRHGCTIEELHLYLGTYLRELDRRSSTAGLHKERLTLSDGAEVDTYTVTGERRREALLIITAFGMPVDFWIKFMERAGRDYDVYTWETRYLPGSGPVDATEIGNERHVLDGLEILDRHGVERAHVLGWCTGAKLAVRMAAEHGDRVRSLTTLSGGFNIRDESLYTPYERNLVAMLEEIAVDVEVAQLYYDLIYQGNDEEEQADSNIRTLLHGTNGNYVQYTSLAFRSPESIYRYAQLITSFYRDTDLSYLETMDVPTLAITAKTDTNTHPSASEQVADRIPGARFLGLPEGDHYLMDSQTETVYEAFREHARAASRQRGDLVTVP
jgi:nucleoside-diphosphate-sugar epimerase/pimeloyl-ACP methyl ester carboxylesterase